MLGLGKPKPIAEYEARGEIERVYHEIPQVLRARGVNLNFRTWAAFGDFLPAVWNALRPNLESQFFEESADQIRADAVNSAAALGRLNAVAAVSLGESQQWQLRRSLDLYHYINPKLLVLTSAVRLLLQDEPIGAPGTGAQRLARIDRGPAPAMLPLEMVNEEPEDPELRALFEDIRQTLSLPSINSDYLTLALWPGYLLAAWERLKPIVSRPEYEASAERLRGMARKLAQSLPLPVPFSSEEVRRVAQKPEQIRQVTDQFERVLPGLILNIALFELDWQSPEALRASPYPPVVQAARKGGGA